MHIAYRNKAIHILLVSFFFSLLVANQCFAGAWTMEKGKLYDRLSTNYYYAKAEFDNDGDKRDFPLSGEFRDLYLGNYIEYGITNSITVINSLYYKTIKKQDDAVDQKSWGIGDIDVGARFRIRDGSWGVLSAQTLAKFPGPYDDDDDLPLGNGQMDFEVRLLYGVSLYPHIPGYCNFEIAYRWRFEDPSDEVRYLIELGADFTKQFYGRVKLDGIYSMDNGRHFDPGGNPKIANNFDLGKLDMAIGVKINREFGIELGLMPEMYGQNTASGLTYTLALIYQLP